MPSSSVRTIPAPFLPVAPVAWRRTGVRLAGRMAGWTAELLADLMRGPLPPTPAAPPAPTLPRYRHPTRGFTWDGRGRQPQWLRDAVLREGYLLAQLRHPRALVS